MDSSHRSYLLGALAIPVISAELVDLGMTMIMDVTT